MRRSAVRRWNVITDRPTTSGAWSRRSRSTVASTRSLHEDEIGDGDVMVGIEVARERGQRAVRHADGDRRHVLERVRHREQQDVHGRQTV